MEIEVRITVDDEHGAGRTFVEVIERHIAVRGDFDQKLEYLIATAARRVRDAV